MSTTGKGKNIPIAFIKMHGLGNDYVYFDAIRTPMLLSLTEKQISNLALAVSNVHTGIGSDGIVLILPSHTADIRMRMFNADGTEAQMCGNATRCIAKYAYETGLISTTTLSLETAAGIKHIKLHLSQEIPNIVDSVAVDMGKAEFEPRKIPMVSNDSHYLKQPITIDGTNLEISAVSIGNPHGVVIMESVITDHHVLHLGKILETHPIWVEKANIEFVNVISPDKIMMRVWERGTGETQACGTGACAAASVCHKLGLTNSHVTVHLPGGDLTIDINKDTERVVMTGPAATICTGTYYFHT